MAAYEQAVFDLVNQIRAENGLDPFVYNQTLADTARAHSQDMIDRNFVDHTNPDGKDPFERMEECIDYLESCPMTEEERELLYYKNAAKLGLTL